MASSPPRPSDSFILRTSDLTEASPRRARDLLLRILDGNIIEWRQGPFVTPSADFAISGNEAVWRRFLAAVPPPGDHDLFAFVKRKELVVTGNLHPLMSHLLYFKALFGCLRQGEAAR